MTIRNAHCAAIERKTRRDATSVEIDLDGSGDYEVATGIPFFDHMLESFAKHGSSTCG